MKLTDIGFESQEIAAFCHRHGIVRLSLFGSALHPDFSPSSDVDVLVEFPPGATPSLLDLGGMQAELSGLLRRTGDLKTPGFLSPRILQQVLSERVVEYAA